MEGREGMNSGVTVIGAEAPSAYHVAPRAENPNKQATTGSGGVTVSVSVNDLAQTSEKKKRGRPRKYGPDGAVTMALSPFSILSASGGDISSGKRGKGRSAGSEYKQHKKIGMENLGDEWNSCPVGINFMPHIITVNAGEDVTMKVISFSQQGPRAICILSANGIISNVTLRQPDSSGGTLTYEGRFEILSLSGSFMPTETEGTRSRSGGMSVSLASPDGRVVGGSVAGLLIAASPVQVVVGSFIPSNPNESKVKKHKADLSQASNTGKQDGMIGQHGYQNSSAPRPNNIGSSSPFQRENWMTMHPVQESTNTATDINISLPGG